MRLQISDRSCRAPVPVGYRAGDRLDALFASGTITSSSGTLAGRLTESGIQALFTGQLPSYGARAFQAAGWNGTFVVMNDGFAGFNASSDSLVFLQNYNITLATHPIVVI